MSFKASFISGMLITEISVHYHVGQLTSSIRPRVHTWPDGGLVDFRD